MGTKTFSEQDGLKFVGDERDIGVISNYRQDVWDWCDANNVDLEYQGTLGGLDVWRIKNEKQRTAFILRWQ